MSEKPNYIWRNVGGVHVQSGTKYKRGDLIESPLNLREIHGDKFELVAYPGQNLVSATPKIPVVAEAPEETRGENVTESFQEAAKAGFVVFKRGTKYHVFEGESQVPLNEKGLKKSSVDKWISENYT